MGETFVKRALSSGTSTEILASVSFVSQEQGFGIRGGGRGWRTIYKSAKFYRLVKAVHHEPGQEA